MIARFHRMHKSRADIQFLTTDKGIIKSGVNSIFATRTGPHCSRRAVSGGAHRVRESREGPKRYGRMSRATENCRLRHRSGEPRSAPSPLELRGASTVTRPQL